MEISSHTERPTVEILIDLIQRMIGVIRYENKFAYALLKQVTANKSTVIDLDGNKIFLQASDDSDYIVVVENRDGYTNTIIKTIIAGEQGCKAVDNRLVIYFGIIVGRVDAYNRVTIGFSFF